MTVHFADRYKREGGFRDGPFTSLMGVLSAQAKTDSDRPYFDMSDVGCLDG